MAELHIKKGDTVYVLSGEDKGKQGKVLSSVNLNLHNFNLQDQLSNAMGKPDYSDYYSKKLFEDGE